ncbi:hypothetical protein BDZ94DRAFT_1266926 [Collybia nuda]|uniref:Uncharacterized protein n=1 Tax=Collybia nuda TaxID=64659 RepID=A0A9P5Y2A7_9AGAR|nr:hypothetical protein BDZ94DRAFT_1266926 [Collybia nuda]
MSSESSPPGPVDSPDISETTPNDSEANSGNMHPGANYFFGFLITFIVLLFIFIGCGLGSRRRMARRRAMFLSDAGPWAGLRPDISQKEPTLWEPELVKGGDMWDSIMPLSMSVLQPSAAEATAFQNPTSASRSLSPFSFTSWIPASRSASNNKFNLAGAGGEVLPEPVELQVAVMIALPSNKGSANEGSVVGLDECQFGVIRIPWEGDQLRPSPVP